MAEDLTNEPFDLFADDLTPRQEELRDQMAPFLALALRLRAEQAPPFRRHVGHLVNGLMSAMSALAALHDAGQLREERPVPSPGWHSLLLAKNLRKMADQIEAQVRRRFTQ